MKSYLQKLFPKQKVSLTTPQKVGVGCGVIIATMIMLLFASCSLFMIFGNSNEKPDPYVSAQVDARIWLKNHLSDPDSLEIIRSEPVSGNKEDVLLCVQYRAKNGFGGYVVETKLFLFKNMKLIEVTDFPAGSP